MRSRLAVGSGVRLSASVRKVPHRTAERISESRVTRADDARTLGRRKPPPPALGAPRHCRSPARRPRQGAGRTRGSGKAPAPSRGRGTRRGAGSAYTAPPLRGPAAPPTLQRAQRCRRLNAGPAGVIVRRGGQSGSHNMSRPPGQCHPAALSPTQGRSVRSLIHSLTHSLIHARAAAAGVCAALVTRDFDIRSAVPWARFWGENKKNPNSLVSCITVQTFPTRPVRRTRSGNPALAAWEGAAGNAGRGCGSSRKQGAARALF